MAGAGYERLPAHGGPAAMAAAEKGDESRTFSIWRGEETRGIMGGLSLHFQDPAMEQRFQNAMEGNLRETWEPFLALSLLVMGGGMEALCSSPWRARLNCALVGAGALLALLWLWLLRRKGGLGLRAAYSAMAAAALLVMAARMALGDASDAMALLSCLLLFSFAPLGLPWLHCLLLAAVLSVASSSASERAPWLLYSMARMAAALLARCAEACWRRAFATWPAEARPVETCPPRPPATLLEVRAVAAAIRARLDEGGAVADLLEALDAIGTAPGSEAASSSPAATATSLAGDGGQAERSLHPAAQCEGPLLPPPSESTAARADEKAHKQAEAAPSPPLATLDPLETPEDAAWERATRPFVRQGSWRGPPHERGVEAASLAGAGWDCGQGQNSELQAPLFQWTRESCSRIDIARKEEDAEPSVSGRSSWRKQEEECYKDDMSRTSSDVVDIHLDMEEEGIRTDGSTKSSLPQSSETAEREKRVPKGEVCREGATHDESQCRLQQQAAWKLPSDKKHSEASEAVKKRKDELPRTAQAALPPERAALVLPLRDRELETTQRQVQPWGGRLQGRRRGKGDGAGLQRTVLVVDSVALTQVLLRKMLTRAGHAVEVAESGAEALQRLCSRSARPVHLLLLALAPAECSEVAAQYRRWEAEQQQQQHHPPRRLAIWAILPPAAAEGPAGARTLAAGADGCLVKPFRKEALVALAGHSSDR